MPTTTSGVTLPPLFDLLAPPAPAAAGDQGGAAFDALLQPPPARAAADDARLLSERQELPPARQVPDNPNLTVEIDAPADEQSRREPQRDSETAVPAGLGGANDAEEPPSDALAESSGKESVAESLAGMTACVLPLPAELQPETAEQADVVEPAPTAGNRGKQPSKQGVVSAEPQAAVVPQVERAEVQTPVEMQLDGKATADVSAAQKSADPIAIAGEQQAAAAVASTANLKDSLQDSATLATSVDLQQAASEHGAAVELSLGENVEVVDPSAQAEAKTSKNEPAFAAVAELPPADAIPAPELAPAILQAPVALPVAVAQSAAVPQGVSSASSPAATSAVNSQGPARRSRLPAELLAADTGRAARTAGANIDAPRLLNRVARAFAAAQQRDGEIQLRLSPPELGSLKLTVQMQEGGLVARLETETTSAKTALVDNLPALRERLAEQGLRIERFDVDLMQRDAGGTPDRPRDQERSAPQAPRSASAPRPRTDSSTAIRASVAASGSQTGLNVIV